MKHDPMEQRIRTAVEHTAPDPLDQILSSCTAQKGKVIPVSFQKKSRSPWTMAAVAAMAALVIGGGAMSWQSAHAIASVVSLDVNPSIQLDVSKKEKVLSAKPLNEDAKVILKDMDLKNTPVNVAVNAIVGSLLQNGYLEDLSSAILISVEDGNAQHAGDLQASITEEVDSLLKQASAGASVLSQVIEKDDSLKELAAASSISSGRAALVEQVRSRNPGLPFEELAELSVGELHQLLDTKADAVPIGREAALKAALARAGLEQRDDIETDVDAELDKQPARYEVELETPFGEFVYHVDAYTGKVLRGEADVKNAAAAGKLPVIPEGIGRDQLILKALRQAGISKDQALGLSCRPDFEDGQWIYEIEFKAADVEYEFELSPDGTILKEDKDPVDTDLDDDDELDEEDDPDDDLDDDDDLHDDDDPDDDDDLGEDDDLHDEDDPDDDDDSDEDDDDDKVQNSSSVRA